ncbi:hypothetical protein CRYUN_Cryun17cG0023600 [Craigia yunnanensis]
MKSELSFSSHLISSRRHPSPSLFLKPHCSAMASFATKSLSFSALLPRRNLVSCASSGSSSGSVVTLLDYGAGNVRSLRNAIHHLGLEIEDVRTPKYSLNADRLIIPVVGAFASAMDVLTKTGFLHGRLGRVSQEGKVVSIGRKMKEKIKGYVSSLILYFDKSRIHEFAQEAEASNTKPITKQEENRGRFKVCLMLFLVFTSGLRCVRSEDIGNALIPGSTAMNSLLANKNLRGLKLSERRQMTGFNYRNFPRGNSQPSNPPGKQANPYHRPCNTGDYCRQGNKGNN